MNQRELRPWPLPQIHRAKLGPTRPTRWELRHPPQPPIHRARLGPTHLSRPPPHPWRLARSAPHPHNQEETLTLPPPSPATAMPTKLLHPPARPRRTSAKSKLLTPPTKKLLRLLLPIRSGRPTRRQPVKLMKVFPWTTETRQSATQRCSISSAKRRTTATTKLASRATTFPFWMNKTSPNTLWPKKLLRTRPMRNGKSKVRKKFPQNAWLASTSKTNGLIRSSPSCRTAPIL
mmetsp:Transcript_47998/g.102801  ORF Transcript_47998/g.102801 Transcript_47998/m.102801 type:complete len:233 (+) Transcript_47998:1018-1716(+)